MLETAINFIVHIDTFLPQLAQSYGGWIYGILFLVIFCETGLVIWPFLPGDSLLFVAGSMCALGDMDIHLMNVLLMSAAILGDGVNFFIGKFFGEKLFSNPDSKIFKQKYLKETEDFYRRHGGKTIIIARFVPIVRTFAPFVAGMGHMHYRRFIAFNVVGAVLWVALFAYAGYFFGTNEWVKKNLSALLMAIIVISVLPMVVAWLNAVIKKKKAQKDGV